MIDYDYIDFPVHILSFNGYKQPSNKNFIKISSRTPVYEYPESIVIKARGGGRTYAKSFDCYGILRGAKHWNPSSSMITSKLIVRAFYSDSDNKWFYAFNGFGPQDLVDKMAKIQKFITEYSTHFKI
jgi:hypothetical protein